MCVMEYGALVECYGTKEKYLDKKTYLSASLSTTNPTEIERGFANIKNAFWSYVYY